MFKNYDSTTVLVENKSSCLTALFLDFPEPLVAVGDFKPREEFQWHEWSTLPSVLDSFELKPNSLLALEEAVIELCPFGTRHRQGLVPFSSWKSDQTAISALLKAFQLILSWSQFKRQSYLAIDARLLEFPGVRHWLHELSFSPCDYSIHLLIVYQSDDDWRSVIANIFRTFI